MSEISVLDKGFVRLDAAMADDLSVVNAARVSFAKRSALDVRYETVGDECYCEDSTEACDCFDLVKVESLNDFDSGLIRYLLTHKHGTPFEHNAFRFHVKCPIFVAREWMRHRIGSFNEMSGRYTKLEPDFYLPESENVRTQVGKPGAYVFNVVEEARAGYAREALSEAYDVAWDTYEDLLTEGVAKELARLCLPVAIYTQFYWTINARSLMNFLSLRNADAAMYEIRQYARVIEGIFAEQMPVTHEAFIANDRVAP